MSDDIWILGISMTSFGKRPESDMIDLAEEATLAALDDAGVTMADMGVLAVGNLMNAAAATPGGGSPGVVQIQVVEGQMFEPRVRVISGDVSVQTVRGAAPALIDASAKEAHARARRPSL